MPHIVVLEGNNDAWKVIKLRLLSRYPGVTPSRFQDVGNFLLALGDHLKGVDVIIMGSCLPLMGAPHEEMEFPQLLVFLEQRFPGVVKCWDDNQAGERAIKWMRDNGMRVPVVFYTHTPYDDVDHEIHMDPKVFYCRRSLTAHSFSIAISRALRAKD